MIKSDCILPTGDGCSAICPVDTTFRVDDASLAFRYVTDGLIAQFGGLEVKIPVTMFEDLRESFVDEGKFGATTKLNLYGKIDQYQSFYITTLVIPSDELIKAEGVAAYLASDPQ